MSASKGKPDSRAGALRSAHSPISKVRKLGKAVGLTLNQGGIVSDAALIKLRRTLSIQPTFGFGALFAV